MRHLRSLAIAFLTIFCLIIPACKQDDSDGDGVADARDKCPTIAAKTKDGCPVERKINAVHFYLETSASMGGYFRRDAEFATIVSDLTAKVDKNIKPIDITFIAETKERFSGDAQQFSSRIANTAIHPQKSSQLHKIIGDITAGVDSNDVVILVSDCILSFTDAEIKSNPEINREKAPSTLKNYVYATFADLNKKKNMGVSIYGFWSKFYGTYYNYQNAKLELNGTPRPFYIWVIGDKGILGKFDAQLAAISSFRPEQELHFGLSEKPVTEYSIIPQIGRKGGAWSMNDARNGIESVGNAKTSPVRFCVGLDLRGMPSYAQDPAYLNKSLSIEAHGCVATVDALSKKDADVNKLRSDPQKIAFDKCSHVLMIEVSDMTLNKASISIRLPLRYATWYMDWSCDDDRNVDKDCRGKTFALQHLITGVKEAYETRNEDYIYITVNLEK